MAVTNRDLVHQILEQLRLGLGPFVLRHYGRVYGRLYLQEVKAALWDEHRPAPGLPDKEAALARLDVQAWFNLIERRWDKVFRGHLGRAERSYVHELADARNRNQHDAPATRLSSDDTRRVADTAGLLLRAVGATAPAQQVGEIERRLLRRRLEAEATASRSRAARRAPATQTTTAGLKPWRHVVTPHRDVQSGQYRMAEFAADLAQVVSGKAGPEYGEAQEFFRRTWLTAGLKNLLVTGIKRVNGLGGDPVVQLQTNFGGGKTHSMLALWHLLGGDIAIDDLPEGEELLRLVEKPVDARVEARRAVIVGTDFDANSPREYEGCRTHTLWGEIAWQLGGLEGYRLVEEADRSGVAPGSDTLLALFETHGPALVIIDELVAFARNIYKVNTPAGSFDSLMTFVQSLSEAARRSSDSLLLVSLPQSELETGGDGGRRALEILSNTIGRIDSVWKPVSTRESFEVVRRRLFTPDIDEAARDAVLADFHEMYRKSDGEFPSEAGRSDYEQQMRAAYPVHPELFTRLYEDWSTLDRFQRTRGVLRMLAAVIHRLWAGDDQSLLIMPGSIPLHEESVRTQMLHWLPDTWPAIVEADIDGESSGPWRLDSETNTLGKYTACRRVARAIFIGSAPSTRRMGMSGLEELRIKLATRQPGEPAAPFNDALRRMSDQLSYLNRDGSRYWYDTRPTLARRIREYAAGISPGDLQHSALQRLNAQPFPRGEGFAAAIVAPQDSAAVPDDERLRIVVFGPQATHRNNKTDSPALNLAREIHQNRGQASRVHRNRLVFLAPDATEITGFMDALRNLLAWRWMQERSEDFDLGQRQLREVEANLKRGERTLQDYLLRAWSRLIVPVQEEPDGDVTYEVSRLTGAGNDDGLYKRALDRLRQDEQLIDRISPDTLSNALENRLWPNDAQHLSVKDLWEYYTRFGYLHRLRDRSVLLAAIRAGVEREDAPFAWAGSVAADGSYRGLTMARATSVYCDGSVVIVRAEHAGKLLREQQRRRQEALAAAQAAQQPPAAPANNRPAGADQPAAPTAPAAPPAPPPVRRWYGSVRLDPQRAQGEFAQIIEEVLQHFSALPGSEIEVRLELEVRREDGFDETTRRVVSENSRTLEFRSHGFAND